MKIIAKGNGILIIECNNTIEITNLHEGIIAIAKMPVDNTRYPSMAIAAAEKMKAAFDTLMSAGNRHEVEVDTRKEYLEMRAFFGLQ